MPAFTEPRFWADAMLGGLARWLRVLGYDVRYENGISDTELIRLARVEGRVVLTRDRALFERLGPEAARYVQARRPLEQLAEVVSGLQLDTQNGRFTRCLLCNTPLEADGPLYRCPTCGRRYWEGSHVRRMRGLLDLLRKG
jgi:uncharacterized protein with PIN domain|nr:MAG: hypothetical protein KatS3mg041_0961 [Bacteroidota bacterium]